MEFMNFVLISLMKSKIIPSDKYEGSIPKDIIRVLHSTEELLKSIVKIEKKVATI